MSFFKTLYDKSLPQMPKSNRPKLPTVTELVEAAREETRAQFEKRWQDSDKERREFYQEKLIVAKKFYDDRERALEWGMSKLREDSLEAISSLAGSIRSDYAGKQVARWAASDNVLRDEIVATLEERAAKK